MSTIVTRTGKGSALTVAEMDANLTNLNTDKLELDDISVTTGAGGETSALSYNNTTGVFTFTPNSTADLAALDDLSVTTASASSGGALAYNNTTGVFTFTPADVSGASLTGITDNATGSVITIDDNDTTMSTNLQISSGHNIDLVNGALTTTTQFGNIALAPNGIGQVVISGATNSGIQFGGQALLVAGSSGDPNIELQPHNSTAAVNITQGAGINLKDASNIFTDSAATDIDITPTGIINMNSLTSFASGIEETVYASTTTTGTYTPDADNGSIHYVALSGSMTINGFNNVAAGQTITLFFDGTGGAYTLTLGASVLSPGGSLALTSGGYDIVTITCIDDQTPVYVATAVNNFQ
jgi:hypothetical protein